MELRTCRNCKRLYNHFIGQNLCPDCTAELDKIFRDVRDYIYDNPEVGIQEVAEEFNISIKTIHGWVREERLEFSSSSDVGLPCESCGTPIHSGRYCNSCKRGIIEDLSNLYSSPASNGPVKKADHNNKMRFIK